VDNEQSKRIPARAMIECILCAQCGQYATATGGGICAACALSAERDHLRADNERLDQLGQKATDALDEVNLRLGDATARAEAAERERDEALARLVELQNAGHRIFSALVAENGVAISSAMVALKNTLDKCDRLEAADGR
jgi:hypothetical protein